MGRAVVVLLLLAGPALAPPCEVRELPSGFGKVTRLADLSPGTWFWSETRQRAYLLLTDGRYADPDTGEVYDATGKVGWPCRADLRITRLHSLDLRPWAAPD